MNASPALPALLPPQIAPTGAAPIFFTLPDGTPSAKQLRLMRIAHASVVIAWGDEVLLTDPWFSQKGGFPGYYSGEALPMGIDQLPRLTGVLASMDHYDHFDIDTFAAYRDRAVPVAVPAGTPQGAAATKAGFTDVRALAPWETTQLGSFRVTAVSTKPEQPATSFEYEHAYVVEVGGHVVLFCAHLMTPEVQDAVAARFPRIDVAFISVNGLCIKPRGYHKISAGSDDAAAMLKQLNVRIAIPIHYAFQGGWASNAFIISHRGTPEALSDAVRQVSPATTVLTLLPGQPLDIAWGLNSPPESGNRASVVEFIDKLNAGDLSAFKLFAAGFVHNGPLPGGLMSLREAIPDLHIKVEHVLVEADAVAVRLTWSGTMKSELPGFGASKGLVNRTISILYRFNGAQIAEEWIDLESVNPAK